MKIHLNIHNEDNWVPGDGCDPDDISPICAVVDIDIPLAQKILSHMNELQRREGEIYSFKTFDYNVHYPDEEGLQDEMRGARVECTTRIVTKHDMHWRAVYKHTDPAAVVSTHRLPYKFFERLAGGDISPLDRKTLNEYWDEYDTYFPLEEEHD